MVSMFTVYLLPSSFAHHVPSVMWVWVGVPLLRIAIHFALYQPLYPEFIVICLDIERADATVFAQFACTLHGQHKCILFKYI